MNYPVFHEEHFRAEFCSLAIVRTRVFVMMDLLCDILQIAMIDGIHIPRHSQFKARYLSRFFVRLAHETT